MPLRFSRDEGRRWIQAQVSGSVTLPDVLEFIRSVRADIEYHSWPLLVDARGASTSMSEADIEAMVEAVRQAKEREGLRGHVALVADDDVLFSRLLLYETRSAEIGVRVIRVFRELADAEQWLTIVAAARHFTP